MSSKLKVNLGVLAGIVAVCSAWMMGCGGATNNDQGTSFLATGWYANVDGSTGLSGANVLLVSDLAATSGVLGLIDDSEEDEIFLLPADGTQFRVFMGLQNRLSNQFIRVVRFDCGYHIPGASISIPDDHYNTSFVIPAAGGGDNVVDGNVVEPAEAFVGVDLLSTDLFSYLNVNRASLPALPFRMTATCVAVGITQAGDVFESNELVFPMTMVEEAHPSGTVSTAATTTTTTVTTSTTSTT
jgi:hypothetical protein